MPPSRKGLPGRRWIRSIFGTAEKRGREERGVDKDPVEMPPTQIGRALQELGIAWTAAHSPQASLGERAGGGSHAHLRPRAKGTRSNPEMSQDSDQMMLVCSAPGFLLSLCGISRAVVQARQRFPDSWQLANRTARRFVVSLRRDVVVIEQIPRMPRWGRSLHFEGGLQFYNKRIGPEEVPCKSVLFRTPQTR